jgi:hypothetical protein
MGSTVRWRSRKELIETLIDYFLNKLVPWQLKTILLSRDSEDSQLKTILLSRDSEDSEDSKYSLSEEQDEDEYYSHWNKPIFRKVS